MASSRHRERFVQLPTDAQRSPDTEVAAAFSAPLRLGGPGRSFDAESRAQLVGVLVAWLHRYTGQDSISLDVFVRDARGVQGAAIDVAVTGDAPLASLIDEAGAALGIAGPGSAETLGNPSNVAATFVVEPLDTVASLDVEGWVASIPAPYDAHFVLARTGDACFLALAYNPSLVGPSTAARLIRSAGVALGAGGDDAVTAVGALPLLDAEELRAIAVEQDGGTVAYPSIPVVRLFEAMAKKQPSAFAASFQGTRLTYRELDERSHRLAHHLVASGVGPEIAVAVCVPPSLDVLVAMLAIWKARGIYLPLDPTHPEALVGRMLDEARPRLVLTTSALSGLTANFAQVFLDDRRWLLDAPAPMPLATDASPSDAAYLFYTSGTTGKPKGVVATQANLAQYIHSAAARFGFRGDDVFASLARYTFSISMLELVSPLCCGGSLRLLDRDEILTPERLLRTLQEVTVLHAGPSLLGSLFRYVASTPAAPRSLPRMRHASSGGDMVPPSVMEGMKRLFPNAELFVIYGCTEVSCMGTTFPIPRDAALSRTFVGKPFPNVTSRILDSNRRLVPFGVVGEIAFAGKGVVRGYLDRPELTAEKFVEIDGQRFYRTGDMGRLHPDGNVEILGRRDFQVQLRGIRIELAGIETTVLELGLAVQCAVVAKTVAEGDVRLVAFVVKPGDGGAAALRRSLAAELPDYMIPHHVVALEAMPLTANGKLDRNRLTEMPWEMPSAAAAPTAPRDQRERDIAEVFARVLGRKEIGIDDNFFDLGGDSLLGVMALDEIARTTGIKIRPGALFESGTVRALAGRGPSGARASQDVPDPIPLRAASSGPPLFMLSGVHIYRPLAERLGEVCTPYGLYVGSEVDGFFESREAFPSVETMAHDYLEAIRRRQPAGPYRLFGYSFGGIVAYEVAQLLRAAGEEVRLLALADPQLPEWTLGWTFRIAQLARLRSRSASDVATFVARRLKIVPTPPDLVQYRGHEKFGPLEARMDASKHAAAAAYMPRIRPFTGDVTLFVAGARLRADPLKSASCGWDPYIGSLAIHALDTDHFRMMSDEPYVTQIAGVLARLLA